MGSGASSKKQTKSKQENLRQPLSTQNRTNITRPNAAASYPLANSSRKPLTPIQPPTKQNRIPSSHNSQASIPSSETLLTPSPSPQVQKRSPSIPNEGASARRIKMLSNGTKPPALSYQQKNNSSNDEGEAQLPPINNFQKSANSSRTNSNVSTKRRIPVDEKSSPSLTGQTGRCSFCPHCKLLPKIIDNKTPEPPPVWFTEPPPETHEHIIMDNYDEEAVRRKIISEHGRLPGIYDYSPNLTIEEQKDHNEISKKYIRLPIIAKPGSRVSPVRTPFPDYDTLQYREKHLNKPYTSTLFTN